MAKTTPTDQAHRVPQTLLEAVRYFADEDVAHSFAAKLRWPDGPSCPRCGCREYGYLSKRKLWQCKAKGCRYQYSVKKGTIFEDSPLGLDEWLPSIWLLVNAKNGISSHELARALGIHQESAWHMLGRIRLAMEQGSFDKFSGEIEADESYVGAWLGTCTAQFAPAGFTARVSPTRLPSWESSSVTGKSSRRWSLTPSGPRSTPRFAATS